MPGNLGNLGNFYLLLAGQRGVHEAAVEQAGPPRVWGQQPEDKSHLHLVVKREPGRGEGQEMGGLQRHILVPPTPSALGMWGQPEHPPGSPGDEEVGEGLCGHEESKDDPVHHPADLGEPGGAHQRGLEPGKRGAEPQNGDWRLRRGTGDWGKGGLEPQGKRGD